MKVKSLRREIRRAGSPICAAEMEKLMATASATPGTPIRYGDEAIRTMIATDGRLSSLAKVSELKAQSDFRTSSPARCATRSERRARFKKVPPGVLTP